MVVDFSYFIFIAILTWFYFLSNKDNILNALGMFFKDLDIAHSDNYIFLLDLEFDNFWSKLVNSENIDLRELALFHRIVLSQKLFTECAVMLFEHVSL